MSVIVGNVEFHAGPTQLGALDDLETVIVNFIDGAQSKLEIAIQELESRPIADAILDRLVHQSHRIELAGESMRRKRKIISEEKV